MRRLQLEDLSKKLGYSKTLISMVLNGKGNQYGISKKTQATVLDAIAKLNYTPNKFAKSLRTGKSYFIGLIVTDISNPFYSTIAKNIESVLFESEYNLMVCSTDESEEREKLLVEMMINQQGVDGLIVASTFKNSAFYDQARFSKMPIVFIDRVVPLFNANYVVIDNYGGSVEIINHLVKKGCKKIACFAITPLYLSTIEDRINGYNASLTKNSLKKDEKLVKSITFDHINDDVERSLMELLETDQDIDAIYALNNHIAVSILKALRKKEFSKFSNVEIACFDDIELFNITDKKVVSVSQPIEDIGKNSSALLLDIISGKQTNKSNIVLATQLIVR
ncbi:LacI family DNA-binding transcriptional regulator [Aurantibacillus circumpalustris]|uniref:LacI family DNA-binding transcriptional regulator n=1 Tax=Aurantibacillus circumpalustris TaxID=3036359 RepID=UPI00295A96C1|nr:LacI family DNA-binding transcriptional regulator [Aurantibacillus circumpalustris]